MTYLHIAILTAIVLACAPSGRADGPNLASDLTWSARTDWLGNPASDHKVEKTPEAVRFEVNQPGTGMKWSAELPEPVDLAKTPWLVIRYRATNAAPPEGYFVWLHGTKGEEQFVAEPGDFTSDGEWHTAIARVKPFVADMLAVQLQAAGPDASIEIARTEFLAEHPKLPLNEVLAVGKPVPGKFKVVDISSACNIGHDALVKALDLTGWPTEPELVASGVPFTLRSGPRAVAATNADKPSEIRVPLKGIAGTEVFLLMAASSKDGGKLSTIKEPHLFSARITYSTGLVDEAIPCRIPSGVGLTGGIGVYTVPVIRGKPLKEIVIRDNVPGTTVYLAAVTVGISTRLGTRPSLVEGAKPYAPARASAGSWIANQSESGDRIEFFDGAHRVVLELRGVTMEISPDGQPPRIAATGSLWRVRVGQETLESTDFKGSVVESRHPYYTIEIADTREIGIRGVLNVTTESAGRMLMQLQLWTNEKRRIRADFPLMPHIYHRTADLSYCFPRRGAVVNNIPISLRQPYSGQMPLQFMDVYGRDGGLYLLTHDRDAAYRYFNLSNYSTNRVSLGVEYLEQEVGPTARFESVVTEIGFHEGDWHAALDAYKDWLETWYKPDAPRKDWFRRVFNFRQQFLRFYIPGGERYFDNETKEYTFAEGIAQDAKAFGGVDYLHLFDWGASEKWGRTGDYDPWDEIGGVDAFREAVEQTQAAGIPVGLYIEGYLIDPKSRVAQAHGRDWQILDRDGKPLPFFAPALNMCSAVTAWQDYLAGVYSRVKGQTHAMGYYCDEMGFADPAHFCYATNHGHGVPEPPLRGQGDLLAKVRKTLGPDAALYTEEIPADSVTRHVDGAFTYSISSVSDEWSPSHVNLTRFALPDLKTFEIIVCDQPLSDRLTAARQIFFNGEGIWLEGPAEKWFAPEVLAFIRKMHGVMRKYEDCFMSLNPTPLVPTGEKLVFANKFPGRNRALWTLFNANCSTVRGELLAMEHTPRARYFDAWNGKELKPRISKGIAHLTLELGPRDVGCVVKELGR